MPGQAPYQFLVYNIQMRIASLQIMNMRAYLKQMVILF